ncbi:MBL fold metallo-hydrolase [Pikeienuella piscinae]|uniref:MBL fold metallo-hydrolase n=1 Tax=Pikeienuella piscinae TaxID=2748098 RepID=A0A7L5BVT2_9RHOB|nr:MBL fold metallo-hydrolase [Pikeienuella piscinae]QIE54928.1 MBL fold metallo-hydrolase [Pikeienuella piscinae]
MPLTRRQFAAVTAAAAGVTVLPFAGRAAGDAFGATGGDVIVHPIAHASFVMETPVGVIYSDPVGEAAQYADLPAPDLILITHEHGDHFNAETLTALTGDDTRLITNPAVHGMLPEALKARAKAIANGEEADFNDLSIRAIPAHNTTPERLKFHPEGRDNGYVLGFDGLTVYISGDTEDIPEMRALEGIDLAFVCMNLPFTMDVKAAASAVAEFKPTYVYPYHYRGRDGGTQDPTEFADLVGDAAEVKMGNWYG